MRALWVMGDATEGSIAAVLVWSGGVSIPHPGGSNCPEDLHNTGRRGCCVLLLGMVVGCDLSNVRAAAGEG